MFLGVKVVGLRELKNRLAEYVRHVRRGDIVIVTDRGTVVAELRRPDTLSPGTRIDKGVELLANRGLLIPGMPNTPRIYPRLRPLLRARTSRELLDSERGGR